MKNTNYEEIKSMVLLPLDYIIKFCQNVDEKHPESGFTNAIIELEILKSRIEKSQKPFLKKDEVIAVFALTRKLVINWNTHIKNNLEKLWIIYSDAINSGKFHQTKYQMSEYITQRRDDLLKADRIFGRVVQSYNQNPNDDIYLYAFFYSFILYTETVEYSFHEQLKDVIQTCELNYEPTEILSITNNEKKLENGKYVFVTDLRAIRNALAHNHFQIENQKLIIKNHSKGYDFQREFTIEEFIRFLEDTSKLYKSLFVLMMIIISTLIINERMINE